MLKVHDRKLGNVAFLCMQGQIVNGETISTPKAFHNSAQGAPWETVTAQAYTLEGFTKRSGIRRLRHVLTASRSLFNPCRVGTNAAVIPWGELLNAFGVVLVHGLMVTQVFRNESRRLSS